MAKKPTTLDPLDLWISGGFLTTTRTIYLGGEITQESADKVIRGILALESVDPHGEITLVMSSEGGEYYPALALYDALRATSCPTVIKVLGHAMSSAMVVLQGADRRLVSENARLMIHDGVEGYDGHARNFEIWGEQAKRDRDTMYRILAARSSKDAAWFRTHAILDKFLVPTEALTLGLVDEIITKYEQPTPDKA